MTLHSTPTSCFPLGHNVLFKLPSEVVTRCYKLAKKLTAVINTQLKRKEPSTELKSNKLQDIPPLDLSHNLKNNSSIGTSLGSPQTFVNSAKFDLSSLPVPVLDQIADKLSADDLTQLANSSADGYAFVATYLSKKQALDKEGNSFILRALHSNLDARLIINHLEHFPELAEQRNHSGDSAFSLAIKLGSPLAIIAKLVDMKVNLNSSYPVPRKYARQTALHIAAECGRLDVVKLLLDAGVTINQTANNDRATALHYAKKAHHENVVNFLNQRGAVFEYYTLRCH